jgi:hypothetical protein
MAPVSELDLFWLPEPAEELDVDVDDVDVDEDVDGAPSGESFTKKKN